MPSSLVPPALGGRVRETPAAPFLTPTTPIPLFFSGASHAGVTNTKAGAYGVAVCDTTVNTFDLVGGCLHFVQLE